ncbi:MFS transporter [soil metagenome]
MTDTIPAGNADLERIRDAIRNGPMRRLQILLVIVCIAINAVDGFDILSISFVAPTLSREWQLTPERVGFLLTAGLFGMTIGAFAISWLVDATGRRRSVLLCLALIAIGMLLSATATNPEILAAYRVITGIGVGGMYSATATLVFEYSSKRRAELAIGMVIFGYSFGTVIGGALSVFLLSHFGWQSVFVAGGVVALVLIPPALRWVPESLEFLLGRQPTNALERANGILARLKMAPITTLPDKPSVAGKRAAGPRDIFKPEILPIAIPVLLAKFFLTMSQYFILTWMPKLMTGAGFSDAGGISFSIVLSLGGMTGGALVGFATERWGVRSVGIAMAVLATVSIAAVGFLPADALLIGTASFLAGAAIFAGSTCLLSISATALPVQVRGTGIGFASGAGRFGSMLGAYLAGLLLTFGMSRPGLCLILALPALGTAWIINSLALRNRRAEEAQAA